MIGTPRWSFLRVVSNTKELSGALSTFVTSTRSDSAENFSQDNGRRRLNCRNFERIASYNNVSGDVTDLHWTLYTFEDSVFLIFIIQHKVFLSNLITGDKIFVWWRVKMLYWKAASSSHNATDLWLLSGHKELLFSLLDHNRAAHQPCVITCR